MSPLIPAPAEVLVGALVVIAIAGLVLLSTRSAVRRLAGTIRLRDDLGPVEPLLLRSLGRVKGVDLVSPEPGRYSLVRTPDTAGIVIGVIIGLATFPFGLVLLVVLAALPGRTRLDLALIPTADGANLRLVGTMPRYLWRRLEHRLAVDLAASTEVVPTGR